MPEIRVKLFANLREYVRTKEIELEGDNVKEILKTICKKFPGIDRMIYEDDKLIPYINIFVNGKDINELSGLDTPLNPNDEIAIFPPVSGG
ncbi:MAG: MoaD/ThiS family protein [Candidatus Methanoperedens sp.]|nr:MoaD/ThiS family protein [Candidatus Methanoperedens sp.]MCE8426037.1 MoaD/ThiS family protein [Candidatus Methanoperedens sp.]MCE8428220.1 MoaD/ThiS family protein [Candidatus Methanoperedens sp.]